MSAANHDAAGETNPDVVNGDQADATSGMSAAIRVVKGNPTDEDVAALVAVLTAAQNDSASSVDSRPRELWGAPSSMHRGFAAQSAYSYAASGRYSR
ncbi:acyl-CoA carboxylase epsilon subunit [Rhodococcus sp. 1R11]|uniref:acyl-CoA carboxylase epsilon subunit n=1 Tax=Rhodococcus sp. 1R11 TaxID=2559614 RepID=UPI001FD6ECA2|nr:acyl-CoA carboxylase epsilon subunit [Rhodococcus sp. 1R11]